MRLAIDTATDIASVAVGKPGHSPVAARTVRGARQHAAQLLTLTQQVLAEAGVRLQDIEEIVVGDGPGSFTGLRIGWAAAKGLAHDREIPLVAIPSLLGAAHAGAQGDRRPVLACFDALRGQVFGSIYEFAPGRVVALVEPGLFTVGELARMPVQPHVAVTDGAERCRSEIEAWIGKPPIPLSAVPPVAASLLQLADLDEGARRRLDPLTEPAYGRPAEAQAKWEARHGRPLPHSSR